MAESPSRADWLALADAIAADALRAAGGDLRLALVLTAEAAAFFAAHASAGMIRLAPMQGRGAGPGQDIGGTPRPQADAARPSGRDSDAGMVAATTPEPWPWPAAERS